MWFNGDAPRSHVARRRFDVRAGDNAVTLALLPSADLEGDGDIYLGRYGTFADCMDGSGIPVMGRCMTAGLDGDSGADLYDSVASERLWGGR